MGVLGVRTVEIMVEGGAEGMVRPVLGVIPQGVADVKVVMCDGGDVDWPGLVCRTESADKGPSAIQNLRKQVLKPLVRNGKGYDPAFLRRACAAAMPTQPVSDPMTTTSARRIHLRITPSASTLPSAPPPGLTALLPHLTSLHLTHHALPAHSTRSLALALPHATHLTCLALPHCNLGPAGIACIVAALGKMSAPLTTLDISYNISEGADPKVDMDETGGVAYVEPVTAARLLSTHIRHHGLKELKLAGNAFTTPGWVAILDAVGSTRRSSSSPHPTPHVPTTVLDIGGMHLGGVVGALKACVGDGDGESPMELDLTRTWVLPRTLAALLSPSSVLTHLTSLTLDAAPSSPTLHDAGFAILLNALLAQSQSHTDSNAAPLRHVSAAHQAITSASAPLLRSAIGTSRVARWRLCHNQIDDSGVRALLSDNHTCESGTAVVVVVVDLTGNDVSGECGRWCEDRTGGRGGGVWVVGVGRARRG
ncbi:uncharacterized protein EV422DRAFT_542125 [Fimicolochytrium jonesii]|uniref:uncharacterized protein n=1 Tax=Fimicolochytrium jonesii TaxID=1396493 RepID=UPI0022FEE85A|nr:uncharacterized protein EV422DRAFT_542125 [Fimicolochytrium jonesii]KAI8817256.1 hypothetical protein EV422DRAFT_542125 [Fimicolochytrium jonesii]